jgi:transcriptional regulator with XRE-family HTH domain
MFDNAKLRDNMLGMSARPIGNRLSKETMSYLKYHRMTLGLTQAEVARRARVSQGAYCDYERGIKRPRPKIHRRLADALERPVTEFTAILYGVDPAEMTRKEMRP